MPERPMSRQSTRDLRHHAWNVTPLPLVLLRPRSNYLLLRSVMSVTSQINRDALSDILIWGEFLAVKMQWLMLQQHMSVAVQWDVRSFRNEIPSLRRPWQQFLRRLRFRRSRAAGRCGGRRIQSLA